MESFSFSKGSLLVAGVEITGWPDGDDILQCERRNDAFTDVVGADGHMAKAQSGDKSGTMTFRLLQTSSSNVYLSGLFAAMEAGTLNSIPCQYVGIDSATFAGGTAGYIAKPSPITRGQGINVHEWIIVQEKLTMSSGNI